MLRAVLVTQLSQLSQFRNAEHGHTAFFPFAETGPSHPIPADVFGVFALLVPVDSPA
jgi:hypothetical protein